MSNAAPDPTDMHPDIAKVSPADFPFRGYAIEISTNVARLTFLAERKRGQAAVPARLLAARLLLTEGALLSDQNTGAG